MKKYDRQLEKNLKVFDPIMVNPIKNVFRSYDHHDRPKEVPPLQTFHLEREDTSNNSISNDGIKRSLVKSHIHKDEFMPAWTVLDEVLKP